MMAPLGVRKGNFVPVLSCVVTCKGRLEHLRQSLPHLARWADAEVIVVDYDCPEHAADWVEAHHPQVRVVRVEDAPLFNLSRARNLGAAAASAPWLLFLDADSIPALTMPEQLRPLMVSGAFAVAVPQSQQLWGALLVSRADFLRVDGYDEAIAGWGSEDEDMIDRLMDAGVRRGGFASALLTPILHAEALRTAHYEIKDRTLNNRVNHLYRRVKRDLARLDVQLPLPDRHALYAQIRPLVLGGRAHFIEVRFRASPLGPQSVVSSLKYQLSEAAPEAPSPK